MALGNYQQLLHMRDTIIEYLEGEKEVWENALKAYEPKTIDDEPNEVKVLREKEAIKLRDRITELTRHIKVIKAMYPRPK
jgi:hypothetical protein